MDCVREHKVKIGGCCCVTFLATIITLLAISFKTLEQTQVGLDFSTVSMKIDDTQLYVSACRVEKIKIVSFVNFTIE